MLEREDSGGGRHKRRGGEGAAVAESPHLDHDLARLVHDLLHGVLRKLVEGVELLPHEASVREERRDDRPRVVLRDLPLLHVQLRLLDRIAAVHGGCWPVPRGGSGKGEGRRKQMQMRRGDVRRKVASERKGLTRAPAGQQHKHIEIFSLAQSSSCANAASPLCSVMECPPCLLLPSPSQKGSISLPKATDTESKPRAQGRRPREPSMSRLSLPEEDSCIDFPLISRGAGF